MIRCPACAVDNPDNCSFCTRCGASLNGGATGQLGSDSLLEGRYIIVKTIGQGGMGAVYMALDQRLDNIPVAIKEMSSNAVGGGLQAAITAFKKEASMLTRLRHPALPIVRDFFSRGQDRWYLVMDYIQGQTLKEILERRGAIPENEVWGWARQLCAILTYLHGQKPPIIFRDLKPANIMLTPEGQVKLIDFGIARHFRPDIANDTTAYGSHGFAPPEQYGQNQTDERSDIYALGATLHYLLTGIDPGSTPFFFEKPGKLVKVSSEMEAVIMKSLSLKAEERPQSAQEFFNSLPLGAAPANAGGSGNSGISASHGGKTSAFSNLDGMIAQNDDQGSRTTTLPISNRGSGTRPSAGPTGSGGGTQTFHPLGSVSTPPPSANINRPQPSVPRQVAITNYPSPSGQLPPSTGTMQKNASSNKSKIVIAVCLILGLFCCGTVGMIYFAGDRGSKSGSKTQYAGSAAAGQNSDNVTGTNSNLPADGNNTGNSGLPSDQIPPGNIPGLDQTQNNTGASSSANYNGGANNSSNPARYVVSRDYNTTVFTSGSNNVEHNGVSIPMDSAPQVVNDMVFVPAQFAAMSVGASYSWDEASQTATLMKGDSAMQMQIGSTTMLVNGSALSLNAAPYISEGQIKIPLKYVAQVFGSSYEAQY